MTVTGSSVTQPAIVRLDPVAALQSCDGHAHGGINAIVQVCLLLEGKGKPDTLLLCGNCARKAFGFEHTRDTPEKE